jgi:ElaA protein
MTWYYKTFETLTVQELYPILQLRSKVFVVEQNCPYLDMDDKDQKSIHLWAAAEAGGPAIAYCRLLPPGVSYQECSIGRVVTDPDVRKNGSGRMLMQNAIAYIEREWQEPVIRIGAQLYLKAFYESLGFLQSSEEYLEDGIPHIEMIRNRP